MFHTFKTCEWHRYAHETGGGSRAERLFVRVYELQGLAGRSSTTLGAPFCLFGATGLLMSNAHSKRVSFQDDASLNMANFGTSYVLLCVGTLADNLCCNVEHVCDARLTLSWPVCGQFE